MDQLSRWVMLEHVGLPSDPYGRHFDLLLESGTSCRTWQLAEMPVLDGPSVAVKPLPPHKLDWLVTKGRSVSNGRGWAKPIKAGFFKGVLPRTMDKAINVELWAKDRLGCLRIVDNTCLLRSNF